MTTLIIKYPYIVADTQITQGGSTCPFPAIKIIATEDKVVTFCGDLALGTQYAIAQASGIPIQLISTPENPLNGSWTALTVHRKAPRKASMVVGSNPTAWFPIYLTASKAIVEGSGTEYALGALEHTSSAEKAMKTAMKFDQSTGGDITVFNLQTWKYTKGMTPAIRSNLKEIISSGQMLSQSFQEVLLENTQ